MKIKVIESGSKGNCTIILSDTIKLIIDLGISYKKLIEEITKLNLDISDLKEVKYEICIFYIKFSNADDYFDYSYLWY